MDVLTWLQLIAQKQGSDLFFTVGAPVSMKLHGAVSAVSREVLKPGEVTTLAYSLISAEQQKTFESELELNVAFELADIGRFRINLYRQRGETSMVVRYIRSRIPGTYANTASGTLIPRHALLTIVEVPNLVLRHTE